VKRVLRVGRLLGVYLKRGGENHLVVVLVLEKY
jgi:hypothetical protein